MVKTNWFTAFPVSMNISYGVKYASLNKFEASTGHIDKNSINEHIHNMNIFLELYVSDL